MRVVQKALTFDDVLLIPAHSHHPAARRNLNTRLTRNISLNIPLVSAADGHGNRGAPRDRHRAGRRHRHHSQEHDAPRQAAEVAKVKRFESGVVKDPITVSPDMKVRDVLELTRAQDFRAPGGRGRQAWSAS